MTRARAWGGQSSTHGHLVEPFSRGDVERGLDPAVPRLIIVGGAKALSKAIRRTFGPATAIQRCQVHKARNIMERLQIAARFDPPLAATSMGVG